MPEEIDTGTAYQRQLAWAIVLNAKALYLALTKHTPSCMCHELAQFILSEAGWSEEQFLAYAEMVVDREQ